MDSILVYLITEGVYGIAHELSQGINCTYFIDGSERNDYFEQSEYNFVSYLES